MTESRGFVDRYAQRLAEEREEAGKHVPVSPPVDALLERAEARLRRHFHGVDGYVAKGHAANAEDCTPCYEAAEVVADMIAEERAAGVEEGRRHLDETAATAAAHAYELGVEEGRRQAAGEAKGRADAAVCAHCDALIWLGDRWRHRDGLAACDNGRTTAAPRG